MTVWVDEIFIVNALADYALLIIAARITGGGVRRRRIVLSALFGGAYAALAAVLGGFLTCPAPVISAGVLMCLIVFGKKRGFFRRLFAFFGLSAAFGGAATAAGLSFSRWDMRFFIAVFLLSWGAFSLFMRGGASAAAEGRVEDIEISLAGRSVKLRALLDTGNRLRDPISGRRVIIAPPDSVSSLLPERAARLIKSGDDPVSLLPKLRESCPVSFSLVPYSSVGMQSALMLTFRPDSVSGREETPLIGIKPGLNIEGGGYSAIGYC